MAEKQGSTERVDPNDPSSPLAHPEDAGIPQLIEDLRELPLVRRKDRLRRLIEKARCSSLIYARHVETNGTALYKEICRRDLEGIVCKKKDGRYSTTAQWLKVMNPDYTQHDGRQEKFTAYREHSLRASR